MKSVQVRLGWAILSVVFLGVYLVGVAMSWDSILRLHFAVGSAAIMVPACLVVLLMWRHHIEGSRKKDHDRLDEL